MSIMKNRGKKNNLRFIYIGIWTKDTILTIVS